MPSEQELQLGCVPTRVPDAQGSTAEFVLTPATQSGADPRRGNRTVRDTDPFLECTHSLPGRRSLKPVHRADVEPALNQAHLQGCYPSAAHGVRDAA
jgi:hypothetical protein